MFASTMPDGITSEPGPGRTGTGGHQHGQQHPAPVRAMQSAKGADDIPV
jgi:hypothetical protein